MAASPVWKVFFEKEYVASCKYPEDAAVLVASRGVGASIKYRHATVVWVEGSEAQSASDSYDFVAETAYKRAGLRRAE